jgi:hypothetical protein
MLDRFYKKWPSLVDHLINGQIGQISDHGLKTEHSYRTRAVFGPFDKWTNFQITIWKLETVTTTGRPKSETLDNRTQICPSF